MSSNRDLREMVDNPAVADAFSFLVSGKRGYKAIIERKVEPIRCVECSLILKGEEKFCPECGTKTVFKSD